MGAIRDYLVTHGVEVKEGTRSGEIRVCCSFCVARGFTQDNRFRLGINENSGWAHCFNCKFHTADFYGVLQRLLGVQLFRSGEGAEVEDVRKPKLPRGFELLKRDRYKPALHYLHRRGVTWSQIVRHKVGYCLSGEFRYRVIFPLLRKKKLVSYVGRDFSGYGFPPYLNSRGKRAVFNLDAVRSGQVVIVSEGIIKALAIEKVMPTGCCSVCTLGSSATEEQVSEIVGASPAAVLLFPDPGHAGLDGYQQTAAKFGSHVPTFVVDPLPDKQADEYTGTELQRRLGKVRRFTPAVALQMEMVGCGLSL